MKHTLSLIILAIAVLYIPANAQNHGTTELFMPLCDSIKARYGIYLGIEKLEVSKVLVRSGKIDIYFNRVLSGYPFTNDDIADLYSIAGKMLPENTGRTASGKYFPTARK